MKKLLALGVLVPALTLPGTVSARVAGTKLAASTSTAAVVEAIAISPYGSILAWRGPGEFAGSPLYEFSGDADGKLGCSTKPVVTGTDLTEQPELFPASCTGPMKDFLDQATDDDWPALTTAGAPVAGPGVDKALLGTIERPGIGDQVTYGGHPLYFWELPKDCTPCGNDMLETVAPLYPWHGIWYAVSAKDGRPAPGPAVMAIEALPDNKVVFGESDGVAGATATVYAISGDRGPGACTGGCAVTWIPLRTSGAPQTTQLSTHQAKEVGVVRRADGTYQVTYEGKPLYLYSAERFLPREGTIVSEAGTAGNGNGLPAPGGGTFSVIPAH